MVINSDSMENTTIEIFEFIEQTLEKSESVLVHSARGQSRASAVIAIYLMKKYKWTLLKTLEFLNSRRPDLEIRASFIQQLNMFETFLTRCGVGPRTQDWNEIFEKNFYLENEELLLRNTFLNARMGPLVDYSNNNKAYNKSRGRERLVWADEKRIPLAQEELDEYDLINKINVDPIIIHRHIDSNQLKPLLSINKRVPFGPKYTGEGKLDFYSQNEPSTNELRKEDINEHDAEVCAQSNRMQVSQKAKFIPVSNTR